MDLDRLPNEEKLNLCSWYFKAGFLMLPFVWAVNTVWFYREAFTKPPYEEQRQIRKFVILSGIGSLIWLAVIIAWVVTFQTQRVHWGTTGEALSFILPLGRA